MSNQNLLAQAHCVVRKGSEHKLEQTRIQKLLAEISEWEVKGDALTKTFTFNNYYQTISFVNALAFMANREDHHPDLSVHYDRCIVSYSTHDVGGLSENDFICAAKTDALNQ